MPDLSPTARTTVNRGRKRALADRERLHQLLADGLVAHLGVTMGEHPVVLPAAYGVDLEGPDEGGTLYLHGSVAAGWLAAAMVGDVCVTITELDGLVAARSGFHHSMNYRSAVLIGRPRAVEDPMERGRALDLIVDQMIPGRAATLREPTRKELAATAVLALPLVEASMKERDGGPVDEPADVEAGTWAGVIPLRRVSPGAITAADSHGVVPPHVRERVAALGCGTRV
ncbi:pyridoxamine 5'-phosphate oxidase family protein [Nocardioides sp. Iso805N]|uniref:pyridoxamine 5'-phosphate oxidase family protein n=1 Tax=Nocardioides sp. Iso805N TaxID=1283287 RepID=UPI0003687C41|nr:pyridoxamine 5'-phosphate oxidase family protein [Nocardioides sp. Iso805N]